MKFASNTVVLLRLRSDAPVHSEEEAAKLQDDHLAHGAALQEAGIILARGPLTDQDDPTLRGFSVWSVDAATARQLANEDPAVKAGRLEACVMTWNTVEGNVAYHHVTAPRSMAEVLEQ